jgi:23S rRNA (cytidine1920-2'-O)/16S rRNA (cytidine1409-2'-O)-methyltransferase
VKSEGENKNGKKRLDVLLVERQFAETRSKAQALIMAGQVIVDGNVIDKPSILIKPVQLIEIKENNPYVSRGGLKLESAYNVLKFNVDNKICLDIGSSTGGFTDFLLQHGAAKVYAVDVGHNQLDYKLRNNPKVVVMEGVNFRYFSIENLKEQVEFVTIDVSFISLDKIIPVAVKLMAKDSFMTAMVKPQFELSPKETKKGVVRDEAMRQKAINKIKQVCIECGLTILGEADSSIKGPKGNLEHFLYLKN